MNAALASVAIALLLLPAAPPSDHAAPIAREDAAPADGCARDAANLSVCHFTIDTSADVSNSFTRPLPDMTRVLGQITVAFEGQDGGSVLQIWHDRRFISVMTHSAPAVEAANARVSQTADHLLVNETNATGWRIVLYPSYSNVGDLSLNGVAGRSVSRSAGVFTITFVGEGLPEGVAPERPAADATVPQLVDPTYDAPQAGTDVLSAWLDDARVGDAIMDAHLRVKDIANVTFRGSGINYVLRFQVRNVQYFMTWQLFPDGAGGTGTNCILGRTRNGNTELLVTPLCELDRANSTWSAAFPERSLGSPGPGELFTQFEVDVYNFGTTAEAITTGAPSEDHAEGERFAFALGGPEVWDTLNHCAFCPVKTQSAWYRDPFAPENIPNTLQVLGAVVAIVSFVGGFVILRKNRRQTKVLISRVDALVAMHEQDAREAIRALAELEQDFTTLYRAGKINESQYQLATQRVVAAASRFALRRELGMESGAVRVPVDGGERAATAEVRS